MRIKHLIAIPTLAASFLLASCEEKPVSNVSTTCYIENGETPLSEDPECDFSYDYFVKLEYPTAIAACPSKETEKAVIDSITMFILNSAFGEEMVTRAIEGRIPGCRDLAAKKNIVTKVAASAMRYNSSDYVKTNLPLWYRTDGANGLGWNDTIESYFKGMKDSYISWIVYRKYYAGGAHGSDFEKCYTIDCRTGRAITEEMLFREGYREELTRLLSERAREILPEEMYSTLFSTTIEPNGNFFFTSKNITWSYGRYEIAPFATGIIRISLPWDKVEGLIARK